MSMQQWALVALIGGIIAAIVLVLYWLFSEKETQQKVGGVKVETVSNTSTPPQQPASTAQQVEPLKPQAPTTAEPSSTSIEAPTSPPVEKPSEPIPTPTQAATEQAETPVRRRGRPRGSKRKTRTPPPSETS